MSQWYLPRSKKRFVLFKMTDLSGEARAYICFEPPVCHLTMPQFLFAVTVCVWLFICFFREVYFSKEVISCPKQKLAMKEFALKCRVDRQKG